MTHIAEDPAFVARVREAYTGRHDVLDAVAWRLRPGMPGPSGAADPASALPALQALVYGRGAQALDAGERLGLEASLGRLMAELEADSVALDAALEAARAATALAEEPPPFPTPAARLLPRSRRLWWTLAAAAAAALLVASASVATAPRNSLDVFDAAQAAGDPTPPPWLLQARSVQASDVRWIGQGRGWDVFVHLDAAGHICMTVVEADRGTGSCLAPDAFAQHGLSVELPFDGNVGMSGNPPRNFVSWGPQGGLRVKTGVICETSVYPC
jgi:hypothetical protein